LDVTTQDNRVIELEGSPDAPDNYGRLCQKRALLAPMLDLPGRLLNPIRRSDRQESLEAVSWETALTEITVRLRDIIERCGSDSVALYGSGQLDTEAWYLGNKLFKGSSSFP
jgi:anaerobic selenocysteine-containing dehydrogenase